MVVILSSCLLSLVQDYSHSIFLGRYAAEDDAQLRESTFSQEVSFSRMMLEMPKNSCLL